MDECCGERVKDKWMNAGRKGLKINGQMLWGKG